MNRDNYQAYMQRRASLAAHPMGEIWLEQERRYMHPVHIYGDIWFVGDSWVCVHLIDTGDGLLLIDSGNCGATGMLIQAIWEAGFNPADVKWILHSHGHVDHIGGSVFFQKMFGTQLYLSKEDAEMFANRPEFSVIQESRNDCDSLFVPDVTISDGDELTFGRLKIQFVTVPGHTLGTLAMFFDMDGEEGIKRVGYFGGYGFNTMTREELLEFGDTRLQRRRMFVDSIDKVVDEPVDIFLANHTDNGRRSVAEKAVLKAAGAGQNPFIDPSEWSFYLRKKKQEMLDFMADPANN